MEKVKGICRDYVLPVINYLISGKLIVRLFQWALLTSGNIAEACLLFSVLWLSAASVAPDFVQQLPFGLSGVISNWSILGLTLLPELVLYSALVTCFDLWRDVVMDVDRVKNAAWGTLYAVPTLIFACMTIATLLNVHSSGSSLWKAPDWILQCRCIAGWSYGLIGLIKANIKQSSNESVVVPSPANIIQMQNNAVVPPPPTQSITTDPLPELEQPAEQEEPITDPAIQLLTDEDVANIIQAFVPENEQQASDTLVTENDHTQQASDDHNRPFLKKDYDQVSMPGFTENEQQASDTKSAHRNNPKPAPIPVKLRIVKLLARTPNLTTKEVAEKLSISESYARKLIKEIGQASNISAGQEEVQN